MHAAKPTSADVEMLQRTSLFAGLSAVDLAEVTQHAVVREAGRGDVIFECGDTASRFYGVVSGWVKLYNRRVDGSEIIFGVFTQGETFAEATLFMNATYPATAEVVAPARFFEFERDYFSERILRNPEMCRGMFASLSRHLKLLTRQIEQLQNTSSDQRVARFLLMLCRVDAGSCTIHLPYDKTLIAGRLGMKPETLSRSFSKLRNKGVRVDRDVVTVSDVRALASHCV